MAKILGLDVGEGLKKGERSKEQNAARAKVRALLRTWLKNKVIEIQTKEDASRQERKFYAAGEPIEK